MTLRQEDLQLMPNEPYFNALCGVTGHAACTVSTKITEVSHVRIRTGNLVKHGVSLLGGACIVSLYLPGIARNLPSFLE